MQEKYMKEAFRQSIKAQKRGEVPVGCVIVLNEKIISKGYNSKEKNKSCIHHAEINAIIKAGKKIKDWRLDDCEMYVTLEPCDMCKEAIKQSRIKKVYYLLETKFVHEKKRNVEYQKINMNLMDEYHKNITQFFKLKR